MLKQRQASIRSQIATSAGRTVSMVISLLPILIGVVLLTGMVVELLPAEALAAWLGRNDLLDALAGAAAGSVAIGHPLTSYVLGGELLDSGVSLVAITAFLVSWVTVGSIQLPAEALMLGKRFALYRNLICFGLAILIAQLTVTTLRLLG